MQPPSLRTTNGFDVSIRNIQEMSTFCVFYFSQVETSPRSDAIRSSSSSLVSLINEYDYRQYLLMHPKVTHKSNSRGTGPSAMVTGNRGGRGSFNCLR